MKKTGVAGVLLIVIGLGIFLLFADSTDDSKKGIVTYADGQVKRKAIDIENWLDAPENTEVISGDKVRTYRDSRAELDLAKLDIIRLAPRTIIDVVKLYEETKDKKLATSIKVEQGELWANVHEVEMETQFDISAPIAAAAITGTVLRLKVDEDSTTQIKVYKGEVKVHKPVQKAAPVENHSLAPRQIPGPAEIEGPKEVTVDEWIQIVKSMQQITINNQGKVVSTGQFSEKDEDEKRDWINWNKELDMRRLRRLNQMKKNMNPDQE